MAISLSTAEGEKFVVSQQVAQQWEWFTPILQGKFLAEDTYEVPLSSCDVLKWYGLAMAMAGESPVSLRSYHDVKEVLLFFGPSNDEWRAYVTVGELTAQQRLTHYELLGRQVRQQGAQREWLTCVVSSLVHNNFYCYYDPVYSLMLPDGVSRVYSDQLTPELKQLALEHRELSVVTGLMQSAWVSQLVDRDETKFQTQEVSWQYVDWRTLQHVKYPNACMPIYDKLTYSNTALTRQAALELLRVPDTRQEATYSQRAMILCYGEQGEHWQDDSV